MLTPNAEGRTRAGSPPVSTSERGVPKTVGQPHRYRAGRQNRHLYVAMLAAVAASAVIAVAVPISRSRANPNGDSSPENADAAFAATGENAAAMVVLIQTPVSFTLHEEWFSVQHRSAETTVGQALGRLGIRIGSRALVLPSLG